MLKISIALSCSWSDVYTWTSRPKFFRGFRYQSLTASLMLISSHPLKFLSTLCSSTNSFLSERKNHKIYASTGLNEAKWSYMHLDWGYQDSWSYGTSHVVSKDSGETLPPGFLPLLLCREGRLYLKITTISCSLPSMVLLKRSMSIWSSSPSSMISSS